MKLGEKIKLLRSELDLNQPELASAAGIEQSYLSKLENDKGSPSFEIIQRIAKALNLSGMELINSLDNFYVQDKLSHIPEIAAQFTEQRIKQERSQKRKFFYASLLVVIGVYCFMIGHMNVLGPGEIYNYASDGEIKPGETIEQFSRYPIAKIGESPIDANARQRQNKSRINTKFLMSDEYRGERYIVRVGENRRLYEQEPTSYIYQPINSIIMTFGVLFILIGGFLFIYTFRFRS